jgi:membrane-associated protein
MHFDLPTLIKTFGYPLVWGIVFAESGLLVGFLLPGDSLLFVAGFLCSVPRTGLDISVMAFGCFVFAVLGDSVGYYTGKRFGRKLFDKEDSKFFKKKHLIAARVRRRLFWRDLCHSSEPSHRLSLGLRRCGTEHS